MAIHAVFICFDSGGVDIRARVLRNSGYEVAECSSLAELADLLRSNPDTELVCVAEGPNGPAEGALALVRGLSTASLVPFRAADHHYVQRIWDLQIHPLTHPSAWLEEIALLLGGNMPRVEESATS